MGGGDGGLAWGGGWLSGLRGCLVMGESDPPEITPAAVSMHPTGMHSRHKCVSFCPRWVDFPACISGHVTMGRWGLNLGGEVCIGGGMSALGRRGVCTGLRVGHPLPRR